MLGRPSGELLVATIIPLVSGLRKVDIVLAHLSSHRSVQDLRFPHRQFCYCFRRKNRESKAGNFSFTLFVSCFAPFGSVSGSFLISLRLHLSKCFSKLGN
jgi:hypothetical protein